MLSRDEELTREQVEMDEGVFAGEMDDVPQPSHAKPPCKRRMYAYTATPYRMRSKSGVPYTEKAVYGFLNTRIRVYAP